MEVKREPILNYRNIIKIELLYDIILEDMDIDIDYAFYVFQNKSEIEDDIPCRILNASIVSEAKKEYSDIEGIITVQNIMYIELELDFDMNQHRVLSKIEEISALEARVKSKVIKMVCKEFSNDYVIPYISMYGGYFTIKDEDELIDRCGH